MIPVLPAQLVRDTVRRAFEEDITGAGDITSLSVVPASATGAFEIRSRANGVVCGMQAAIEAFSQAGPELALDVLASDGDPAEPGESILNVSGNVRDIMLAERTALNFLGRMSGIATLTRRYADAIVGTKARIVHTRKTTPGLRAFEIQAVRAGGGSPHRFNLSDAVLIKDNHIAIAGGLEAAVARVRKQSGHMVKIEVEVDTLDQLAEALALNVEAVLLDNMSPETLAEAVAMTDGRATLEASGRVTAETAPAIAKSGVDLISVGWITHSAPCLDIGLDFEEAGA